MYLVKEVVKEEMYEKVTVFNPDGQPKSIAESGHRNLKQEFSYDDKGRIKEVHEQEYCYDQRTERRVRKYEYNGKDYRVLTYVTHQRMHSDATSNNYLTHGIEEWHLVDRLISVQEVKFDGSRKVFDRYHSLETNEIRDNIASGQDIGHISNDAPENTVVTKIDDESHVETLLDGHQKRLNHYQSGILQKTQVVRTHAGEEYVAFETVYSYSGDGRTTTEKYGRFNSEMIIYKVVDESGTGNVVETVSKEKSYFEESAGYYDFQAMQDALGEDSLELSPDSFDVDFDTYYKTIVYYDGKGNEIYSICTDPMSGQFYDAYASHYEYNEDGLLEFEVVFKQTTKDGPMENFSVKKYYYVD